MYTFRVTVIGKTEIETIEGPEELQFAIVHEKGWLDLFVPPILLSIIVIWSWIAGNFFFAGFAILAAVIAVAKSLSNPATRLFVKSNEVVARGNIGQTLSDEIRIPAPEIDSLGYFAGSEGDNSGLYVWRGWTQTCLVSGINKEQATAIAETIRRKFPDLERGDRTPTSILHGEQSGVRTLSLSPTSSERPPRPSTFNSGVVKSSTE